MRRALFAIATFLLGAAIAAASPIGPDGAAGRRLPGKFIWFDLATEDVGRARAFYGAVFGWTFREVPAASGPYTLIERPGGKVGGMFARARPAGAKVGSRWISVMSVADVEQAARRVREAGGQVLRAPATLPGRGTHAVFRDPEGAVFAVLAAEGGDPPDTPVDDGDVFWLDLFTRDPAKSAAFYSGLAPYDITAPEGSSATARRLLATGGFARAGIVPVRSAAQESGWLPYILVEDVPAALDRVRRAGGRVVVAPRADRLDGNVAVVADPLGGVIGIVNWVAAAASGRAAP